MTNWQDRLTPEQYRVTRQKGTEPPFSGAYNHFKEDGCFVCVCCEATLFDSAQKYDSGSGWPSFWAPAEARRSPRSLIKASECGAPRCYVMPVARIWATSFPMARPQPDCAIALTRPRYSFSRGRIQADGWRIGASVGMITKQLQLTDFGR